MPRTPNSSRKGLTQAQIKSRERLLARQAYWRRIYESTGRKPKSRDSWAQFQEANTGESEEKYKLQQRQKQSERVKRNSQKRREQTLRQRRIRQMAEQNPTARDFLERQRLEQEASAQERQGLQQGVLAAQQDFQQGLQQRLLAAQQDFQQGLQQRLLAAQQQDQVHRIAERESMMNRVLPVPPVMDAPQQPQPDGNEAMVAGGEAPGAEVETAGAAAAAPPVMHDQQQPPVMDAQQPPAPADGNEAIVADGGEDPPARVKTIVDVEDGCLGIGLFPAAERAANFRYHRYSQEEIERVANQGPHFDYSDYYGDEETDEEEYLAQEDSDIEAQETEEATRHALSNQQPRPGRHERHRYSPSHVPSNGDDTTVVGDSNKRGLDEMDQPSNKRAKRGNHDDASHHYKEDDSS